MIGHGTGLAHQVSGAGDARRAPLTSPDRTSRSILPCSASCTRQWGVGVRAPANGSFFQLDQRNQFDLVLSRGRRTAVNLDGR